MRQRGSLGAVGERLPFFMHRVYNMSMTTCFIIRGETPSKKNSRINLKNGRSIPSEAFRRWHSEALLQITKQKPRGFASIETPCLIDLTFIHGDLRRRDSDNGTSSILDTLVDSAILTDDNWKIVQTLTVHNDYEKNEPCCIVKITY